MVVPTRNLGGVDYNHAAFASAAFRRDSQRVEKLETAYLCITKKRDLTQHL